MHCLEASTSGEKTTSLPSRSSPVLRKPSTGEPANLWWHRLCCPPLLPILFEMPALWKQAYGQEDQSLWHKQLNAHGYAVNFKMLLMLRRLLFGKVWVLNALHKASARVCGADGICAGCISKASTTCMSCGSLLQSAL